MGGYWVMIGFQNEETKNSFKTNVVVASWFTQIIQAHNDFNIEERVAWVEIEGVPFKWWSKKTFRRIASRWGNVRLLGMTWIGCNAVRAIEIPVAAVPDTCFEDESNEKCMDENVVIHSEAQSDDPFGIYDVLNKKGECGKNDSVVEESRKFPPGFTPTNVVDSPGNGQDDVLVNNSRRNDKEGGGSDEKPSWEKNARCADTFESTCSGHFKKSGAPRTGGSIIHLIDELVTVGQTMGYDMTGLAQKAKKDWVKELCVSNRVNFVSLQETKMENIDLWGIKRCWGNYDFDYVYSEAVGNSGGILSIWDPNVFKKLNATVSDFFTIVRGTWLPSGKKLLVISVYAPQELRDKKMLWDYLVMVICNWDGEVVAMGDFNEVRDCSERFGSVFNKKGAEVFNNFIMTAGLVEVPLGGCSFTWCHKTGTKMSKLDRFLISDNLMCSCPSISSISLDRYLSDHRPILMRDIHNDYGSVPFKFFHYWWEIDGFDKLIEDSWNDANICDQNDYINLMKKLKFLKEKIRKWNVVYKESKNGGMRNLKADLHSLDAAMDKGESSEMVSNRRMEVIRLMQDMEKVDNLEVAQKAKVKWAIEGDENSKYYHGVLNKKRSRLTIRGVMVDGVWIEQPSLVKKEFLMHFKKRFEQPCRQDIRLEMDFINRLSIDQKDDLESDVTNDEVRKAVWDCGVDKTPGPDGFTFGFYRRYWRIIERDVIKAVKWFFTNGSIPNGGNASFITLIPKITNANMVKDFRPISLIGSIYKIVAKILANRLVTVLDGLVNEVQSAFVTDRQILDGPFMLNEIVQWCKKRNKQAMIFKVDFEKAFDSVRWDFLEDIMRKFGFGDKWCMWIRSCLRSSRGSVIVNGSPTEEFQFYRGLKQGDPLSPFLFILIMESLHISFQRVVDAGLFKGIKLGSALHMSHLFYADDAIFMGQWNQTNIDTITRVLEVFYRASGVTFHKFRSFYDSYY
ncbi:RNA-directed DNA polymerase, eukaryota [Tanacetum coccineum]